MSWALALEHAPKAQRDEADALVESALSGARAERWVSGIQAAGSAFEEGRVAELVVHEDSVDHWGTADDARLYESPLDDQAIEKLLEEAVRTSANLRFCLNNVLLTEHEGVLATLRW